jgi:hypothetical protein
VALIDFECNPEFDGALLYPNITGRFNDPGARSDLIGILGSMELSVEGKQIADTEVLPLNLVVEVGKPFDIFTCFECADESSSLTVSGRLEVLDFSAANSGDIVGREGRVLEICQAGLTAKVRAERYEEANDEDQPGCWILSADMSSFREEKFALRVGFEDGLYSADWDFADFGSNYENHTEPRQLCVCGVEEGDLLTIEVRLANKIPVSEEFRLEI